VLVGGAACTVRVAAFDVTEPAVLVATAV